MTAGDNLSVRELVAALDGTPTLHLLSGPGRSGGTWIKVGSTMQGTYAAIDERRRAAKRANRMALSGTLRFRAVLPLGPHDPELARTDLSVDRDERLHRRVCRRHEWPTVGALACLLADQGHAVTLTAEDWIRVVDLHELTNAAAWLRAAFDARHVPYGLHIAR